MITPGAKITDIGTDHAYLPIYLALNKIITHAIACDIKKGPLESAKSNIKKYNLSSIIETRPSDGLKNLYENEADEIIIAGMGGNMIAKILQNCAWKNKNTKKFILQPMKYEDKLRMYLAKSGYEVVKEEAVFCSGKVYTVMAAVFTGTPYFLNDEEKYIGKLSKNIDTDAKLYIEKQIKNLQNHQKGAHCKGLYEQENHYNMIIKKIKHFLKES